MKYILAFLLSVFIIQVQAQDKRSKFSDKFDDVFEEEENQNLTLRFFNALNGEPVQGALVTIDEMDDYETDEEGKIRFPVPDDDGFLAVHFECPEYITSDFKVEVIAGTLFFNRISVSPALDLKQLRIVLDWDQSPADLDAHFMKKNSYHISYRDTRILADGLGALDRDDMDGFGPETITVADIDDLAEYEYVVHDYTNRNNSNATALSKSKASIKVYGKNRLLYVFQVPNMQKGTTWSVFKIHEGQFIESNQIRN